MLTLNFLPAAIAVILTGEPSWIWTVPLVNLAVLIGGLIYTIMAVRLSLQMFSDKLAKAVDDIEQLGKRTVILERVGHITERVDAVSERVDKIGGRLTIIETQHDTNHPREFARIPAVR